MSAALARNSFTTHSRPRRIKELDGARGLAIAMVLAYHYAGSIPSGGKVLYYALLPTHLMWSGVDLFFVLSGLLIGGILLDNRGSPNYFSAFYGRRVFRIFPIYYLMIALMVIGILVFPKSGLFSGTIPIWVYALYGQNLMGDFTRAAIWLGPTWSLAVEEQFYLLFPLVVRVCERRTLAIVAVTLVIAAPLLRTALIFHGYGFEQVYPLLPSRADALAFGVIGALIIRSPDARAWVQRHRWILYGCLAAFMVLCVTLLKWTTFRYVGTLGYSITAFMYFLLLMLLLIAPHPLLLKMFCARWLIWLGSISYCVYLIHQPVMYVVEKLTHSPGPLAVLFALGLTFGIAQASWVLMERRFVNIGHSRYKY